MTELQSLSSLITSDKVVEVPFPGLSGFKVTLKYLDRETNVKIRKKATRPSFKGRNTGLEEFDDDLFLELFCAECIKGWTGLTLEYVNKLAPIDLSGVEDAKTQTLKFSQENALTLLKTSSAFDNFITERVGELEVFTQDS